MCALKATSPQAVNFGKKKKTMIEYLYLMDFKKI